MSKQAFVFPGQGAQSPGMGQKLYESSEIARSIFEQANEILGFRITETMFTGSKEQLMQTDIAQPAIFIHSAAAFATLGGGVQMDMVAGHSLGEFSALVANKTLQFEDALRLVAIRAAAMQRACEETPSAMAAILALSDETVEEVCAAVQHETGEIVGPANYNCPGQLVISGSVKGIEIACERLKAIGARRAMILQVSGAFHSPLMASAREELAAAVAATPFSNPICPVYQNVVAEPVTDPDTIRQNLVDQLTGAVKWTQCTRAMLRDGATSFTECGPGKVLLGLIHKIQPGSLVNEVN
jgi:[acyl-carrier-protein] S-malonyltransferase